MQTRENSWLLAMLQITAEGKAFILVFQFIVYFARGT